MRPVIGPNGWQPGRGDYGSDHSTDLIAVIEEHNCSTGPGCAHAGSLKDVEEYGPSGSCGIIGRIFFSPDEGIPEIKPEPAGPVCSKRVDRRPEPLPVPQAESLFDMNGDGCG